MARAEVRAVRSVSPRSPRASSRMAVITSRMSRTAQHNGSEEGEISGEGCAVAARRCADEQPSGCGLVRSRRPGLRVAGSRASAGGDVVLRESRCNVQKLCSEGDRRGRLGSQDGHGTHVRSCGASGAGGA
eukprot:5752128-Prymnesium_polylepis.1